MDMVEHVYSFAGKEHRRIQKIFEPMQKCFGINGFWYYTIDQQGYLAHIGNHVDSSAYFFDHALYKGHPYFKDPQHLPTGCFLSDLTDDTNYHELQGQMHKKFNLNQIFMVMEKEDGVLKGYGFRTDQYIPQLESVYLRNIPVFKKFIRYFHREAEDIVKHAEKNKVQIASHIGPEFYAPGSVSQLGPSPQDLQTFLKIIDPGCPDLSTLSKREKQCLKWILKGRSAPQIAEELSLSPRTVEHYIENMKNKLGCSTKQELYDLAADSPEW